MMRSSFSASTYLLATTLAVTFGCAGLEATTPGATSHDAEARTDGVATDDCAILCRRACHSSSGHCFRDCFDSCWGGDPPPPTYPSFVLVAGGEVAGFDPITLQNFTNTTPAAEIFQSDTNTFTATTGAMHDGRTRFYMTALDDGRVLVAGGLRIVGRGGVAPFVTRLNGAETFAASIFTQVTPGMHDQRGNLAGAKLSGGNVLLVGGDRSDAGAAVLNTAEIFQSATNTFASTPPMSRARRNATATTVQNGATVTVLVAGGYDGQTALNSAEVFDPALQQFRPPRGSSSVMHPRWQHTATLLNNGKVLLTGGLDGAFAPLASADLYDPVTETFNGTGSMQAPRVNHTATLLQNGQVLIAGGTTDPSFGAYNTAELYDPVTGRFTAVGSTLRNARYAHTATLLKDGRVFLIGGRNPRGNETNTTEFFDGSSFNAGPNMLSGRAGHSAVLLP
jgi:hypothetical protein